MPTSEDGAAARPSAWLDRLALPLVLLVMAGALCARFHQLLGRDLTGFGVAQLDLGDPAPTWATPWSFAPGSPETSSQASGGAAHRPTWSEQP